MLRLTTLVDPQKPLSLLSLPASSLFSLLYIVILYFLHPRQTGQGSPDLFHANLIAREMVLSFGMGPKTGPQVGAGGLTLSRRTVLPS